MKNLFSFVVILSSVIFLSACSGEESVLMASLPETPAEKPEIPEEDEDYIDWEFSFSTIVERRLHCLKTVSLISIWLSMTSTKQNIWGKPITKILFVPIVSVVSCPLNGEIFLWLCPRDINSIRKSSQTIRNS